MLPEVSLKNKLLENNTVLGVLITNHLWLGMVEISIAAGLDYVIVDLEHLDHGHSLVADACSIGRVARFPVLIRPPSSTADCIRTILDLGPAGLLLPMIESGRQLDEVREGLFIPPRGKRRPGGPSNSWLKSFEYDDFRQLEESLVIIPQIESREGLADVHAIARHPLTTALGIGPFDLSTRLGACGKWTHPELLEAEAQIHGAAQAAGKQAWTIGNARLKKTQGYRFICIGEPMDMLKSSVKQIVDDLRA